MFNIKKTWVNKYKPEKIDEMVLDNNLKEIIKSFKKENIKNIILYGESGIGKTSLSHLIPKYLNIDYKEYNASDTRGINTINEILILHKKSNSKLIIILDECDNITIKAQELIINVMDNYKNIIFIFTCNSYDYMLKSIMDRSVFIHLKCKDIKTYSKYLTNIINKEKMNISKKNIEYIINELNFDIRMIINKLEILKIINKDDLISKKKINEINTFSCIKECIEILNILFDNKKSLLDFLEIYEKNIEISSNFIDFININLYIFNNYELYKNILVYKFTNSNIIDFLSILHKNNVKLLKLYIYTELQYYNILIELYNFSRKIMNPS